MPIKVVLLKNGDLLNVFDSIQEAHRYLCNNVEYNSLNELYDVINLGIDEHRSWHYKGDVYDFRATKEMRLQRLNRRTRKNSDIV